jgi:RimJ/RimL family protein N-acetyltransferase
LSDGGLDLIHTARMVGERLEPRHYDDLCRLLCDPRVARTLTSNAQPPSKAEVRYGLEQKIRHWENHGFGLWLLRDQEDGALVGRGGLQHTWATGQEEVEVGWAIIPERWGEGLATELARTSIEVAFSRLRLPDVIAYTTPANVASRRVMKKTGFSFERRFSGEAGELVLYRLRCAADRTG